MARGVLTASVIAVLVISVGVSAKRGCSAFGHSCFGGHGKRSDSSLDSSSSELGARRGAGQAGAGQAETPPQPGYPHPYGVLSPGDDIIPVRDGGVYEREGGARDAVKQKMRNILRYWMDYYRRSRLGNDDGYLIETL